MNIETGELVAPRARIATPEEARPEPVAEVVGKVARFFNWSGPIGCGFPGVVRSGIIGSASNVSKEWLGVNAAKLLSQATGSPVRVINDADAAGIAEVTFGAGRGRHGTILIVTIGTGLGTALFTEGHLLPNTELGHIEIDGQEAELAASDAARKREELSWKKWGRRFNRYLNYLERYFSPDLIILGGGGSKQFELFREFLKVTAEIKPAELLNDAGIVGAALAAGGRGQ